MIHSRHFVPGASTLVSILGALSASEAAAWGGALTAFLCTLSGVIWDQFRKRDALVTQRARDAHDLRKERARAAREKLWADWCLKRRTEEMDAGRPDPFPDGLPVLEADDDRDEREGVKS